MKRIFALLAFAGAAFAQPAITAVLDGGAYTTGIPQGAVFVVKGTGLSASGIVQATAPSYPTVLNNVGIKFTATSGGAVVTALMVYTYNSGGVNQLAAVLPSTAAIGNYNVTVTNGAATSAPFAASVVARKMGIVTADGSGSGQAQATIGGALILNRTTNQGTIGQFTSRSAHPGERMDLWGTGLGADLASDSGGTSGDQTAAGSIRVVVNGSDVTPLYAGRSSGFPGLDQIAFNLPTSVTPGCNVTVQVRAGGVLGNVTTIGVAASGDACPVSSGGGGGSTTPTQSEINSWIAQGSFTIGSMDLSRDTSYSTADTVGVSGITTTTTSQKTDSITGGFSRISGADLAKDLNGQYPPGFPILTPAVGACTYYTLSSFTNPFPNLTFQSLDGGPQLASAGPNGTQVAVRQGNAPNFSYSAMSVPNTYLAAGHYTLSGPGGADVGAFSGSLDIPSDFVVTNSPDDFKVINRSAGITVRWSGGEPTSTVTISGSSFTAAGSATSFVCVQNASAGSFTVPGNVVSQLPPSPVIGGGGFNFVTRGNLSVDESGKGARFTAPSGVDFMTGSNSWSFSYTPQYQ